METSLASTPTIQKSRLATLIITGIAVNYALGVLVTFLRLPVFLDMVGTIIVAIVAGYRPSIAVAILSLALRGVTDSIVAPAFAGTAVLIAIYSSFVAGRGWLTLESSKPLKAIWRPILAGLLLSPLTASLSAPIAVLLFGGIVPNAGYSGIFLAYKSWFGISDLAAGFATSLTVEPLDKVPQVLIAVWIVHSLPKTLLANFPQAIHNLRLTVSKTED